MPQCRTHIGLAKVDFQYKSYGIGFANIENGVQLNGSN
jgi:hypothetical protein